MSAELSVQVKAALPLISRASLFGEFQLSDRNGTTVTISNRRARALLAILCLEPDQPIAREQITRLLWSGRFEAQAKASLRQCLLELGKTLEPLGQQLLVVTRDRVALDGTQLQTDLAVLEQTLNDGRYEDVIQLLGSIGAKPLLDDLHLGDAFSNWLAARREQVALRLQALVDRAVDDIGDPALRKRLLNAWAVQQPTAVLPAVPETSDSKTRIAVLPFKSLGSADGPDYFTDGMVDELITTLGQVPQLLVAGRISSFHFRDSPLTPAQIAGELGVTHLIEGSVQRHGEQIRIHVHLIAGDTGFELWGQRFDGSLDSIFQLQENVAQAVTRALAEELKLDMAPPLVHGMTHSREAYDLYLQGKFLCAKIFGDGILDNAITLLEQALALDPDFAECWVMLAEANQLLALYTRCDDREAVALRMAECAQRAIAISPTLAYPYCLLGLYRWTQSDIVGGLDLAFKAYELEPENPAVGLRLGTFLVYCGLTRAAIPYVKAAIDRDPVDFRKYAPLCGIYLGLGDLKAARDTMQRTFDLGAPASLWLGLISAAMGEHDLAVEQYPLSKDQINSIVVAPAGTSQQAMDAYWVIAAKGVCSGKEADRQAYWQILEFMYATLPDKREHAIVNPALWTGYADLFFRAVDDHFDLANMFALIAFWVDFDPIRQVWQHPDFMRFAERVGWVAAWYKYGWPDLLPAPGNRT